MRKVRKTIILSVLLVCSLGLSSVANAASSLKVYINFTYGYLTGSTTGGWDGLTKLFNSTARTTAVVPKIRSKIEVEYTSTGASIGNGDSTGWLINTNYAGTDNYEMSNWRSDGFKNITLTAYGTADAITGDPYVVYTNYTI